MDAANLRRNRDAVLRYIYEHGAGNPNFDVAADEIQQALGLSNAELNAVAMLFVNQNLITPGVGSVGCIGLNTSGQREAERLGPPVLMRDPPSPTSQNVYIRNATNSTVQIAGSHSHQHATHTVTELHQVLDAIERHLTTVQLEPTRRKVASDLITALRGPITGAVAKATATALSGIVSPFSDNLGKRLLDWFTE